MRVVFGPSARALGKGLATPLEKWAEGRAESAGGIVMDAARITRESGMKPNAVPGRVLWPLLEKASVEEDSGLRARWAALLANASMNPEGVLPSFVAILGELAPIEARLLQRIHEVSIQYTAITARTNNPMNTEADHLHAVAVVDMLRSEPLMADVGIDSGAAFDVYTGNLHRMELINSVASPPNWDGLDFPLATTPFGDAFVAACMTPAERASVSV